MGTKLNQYLFVFDELENEFPERWRVLRTGDMEETDGAGLLSGTVHQADAGGMRELLESAYPRPRYDVSTAWANTWEAVQANYRGLRDHDGPPVNRGHAGPIANAEVETGGAPRSAVGNRPARAADPSRRLTRVLLVSYIVVALAVAGALGLASFDLPADLPRLEPAAGVDLQSQAQSLGEQVRSELTWAVDWLAPMGVFNLENRLRGVIAPNDWELANVVEEVRVERLNRSIGRLRSDFLAAARLLGVVLAAGVIFAGIGLLRPGPGPAVALCLPPLFTTPVATEPILGVDTMGLFYPTLPMLVAGGGVLVIEAARAIGRSVEGPRAEAWMRVWVGLGLVVVGAVASAVGLALAAATGAGVVMVAAAPVVYGVISVLRGLAGLLGRPR